eukprot:jgi/Botrbrau1/6074/Bobra.177_1s0013.1
MCSPFYGLMVFRLSVIGYRLSVFAGVVPTRPPSMDLGGCSIINVLLCLFVL